MSYAENTAKAVVKVVCVGEATALIVLVPLTATRYDFVIPSLEHPDLAEFQEGVAQSQYVLANVAAVNTSGDVTIVVPTATATVRTFPPTVTIS